MGRFLLARVGKPITMTAESWVSSAAFSPDATRIVTASWDYTARLWDATIDAVGVGRGQHGARVKSMIFSADGTQILTASKGGTAHLWDIATGTETNILRGHEGSVNSAIFSPDGTKILTASRDRTARLWDAMRGIETKTLRGHEGEVNSAVFSPDGCRTVTASDDCTVRVWDAITGKETNILRHGGRVNRAVFSPDGRRILTIQSAKSDNEKDAAQLWDAKTGKKIRVLFGHKGLIFDAIFSPDANQILTVSGDNTARLWDATIRMESGGVLDSEEEWKVRWERFGDPFLVHDQTYATELKILRGHESNVRTGVFSPDGTQILTASDDRTARLWDAKTGTEIRTLRGHEQEVWRALFLPDGMTIVTVSYRTARIWDARAGTPTTLISLDGWIDELAVREDAFAISDALGRVHVFASCPTSNAAERSKLGSSMIRAFLRKGRIWISKC
jgi:WD40 repeat protein